MFVVTVGMYMVVVVRSENWIEPDGKIIGRDFLAFYMGGAMINEGRLDHLYDFAAQNTFQQRFMADPSVENKLRLAGHYVHFDLDHSGAVLAWQYFHPDEPAPMLLRYVEDQDLWNWKLPGSEEVNAAIASYPRRFDVWSDLLERSPEDLAAEGAPIVRANQMEVTRVLHSAHPIAIGTRRVEAVNATQSRSNTGHELAQRAAYGDPWGCVYRMTGDRVYISLYSIGDFDVSAIAGENGGGGHRNAAGFSVSLNDWVRDFA